MPSHLPHELAIGNQFYKEVKPEFVLGNWKPSLMDCPYRMTASC